ncbi:hypothetical protein Rs2_45292 [Raphanus sativus]|nr:hypothetical protein Rs2_45292 [Raphanus sativus]
MESSGVTEAATAVERQRPSCLSSSYTLFTVIFMDSTRSTFVRRSILSWMLNLETTRRVPIKLISIRENHACEAYFLRVIKMGAMEKDGYTLRFRCNPLWTVPTVFDNFSANVVVNGATVNLGLWDTADFFILAFSLFSKASYENVSKKWIPELKHYAPGVPIILFGSKLGRGAEEANRCYVECSSKFQENVKPVFDAAVRVVLQPLKQKKKKSKAQKACSIL